MIFKNRYPVDAAKKAATRGWIDIALLDMLDKQTVHVYKGERVQKEVATIKNKEFREEKFGNAEYYWIPKVHKMGVKTKKMYLKEQRLGEPIFPSEQVRQNKGGRPAESDKENARHRNKKAGKKLKSKRGVTMVIPDSDSEEETRVKSSNKVFKGYSFLLTRVSDPNDKLANVIQRLGGKMVDSIQDAANEVAALSKPSGSRNRKISGSIPIVLAPKPLLTHKFLFALAQGLCPILPEFVNHAKKIAGLPDPLTFAVGIPKPLEGAKINVHNWPSLRRRNGLEPLDMKNRVFYGMTLAAYQLNEGQKLILTTAGAKIKVIDRVSARKVPKSAACVISGQRAIFTEDYRGDAVGFHWVIECLLRQRVIKATDEFKVEDKADYDDEEDE